MENNTNNSKLDFGALEEGVKNVSNLVDQAVSSQNYQKLSNSITDMVNSTIKQYQQTQGKVTVKTGGSTVTAKSSSNANSAAASVNSAQNSDLYGKMHGERIKDAVLIGVGAIIFFYMLVGTVIAQFINLLVGRFHLGSIIGSLIGLAVGGVLMYLGFEGLGKLRRFKKYKAVIGNKTYCDFKTLGKAVGKNANFVCKDVKSMISKGWFVEGYIDEEKTTLITSHESYQQYEASQKALEAKKTQAQQEEAKKQQLSPEVKEMLDKGEDFIKEIHKCNDEIPGEEMSGKIEKTEKLVDQILDRVKDHPESVRDLKKLMNYYLPTTVKLLNAYADMDKQATQGETIKNSKQEIENSVDTLNDAFEKLLDTAFKDTALDVSSDISVLQTMLAQEGLTGSDFDKTNKGE